MIIPAVANVECHHDVDSNCMQWLYRACIVTQQDEGQHAGCRVDSAGAACVTTDLLVAGPK